MCATPCPVHVRGGGFTVLDPVLADRDKPETDEPESPSLRCRTCGLPVASMNDRVEVAGKHGHALFNPAGILFEVGCFTRAPGCRYEGEFTFEFTWFAGYAWRFAMCRRCDAHLGWEYRGPSGGFVGLIMTELRES